MPTPNDRTVPSPDRDEELEKFIQKRFDLNCVDVPDDDWNHYMVREEDFKRAAIDIAAFSARRAREKAIEECLQKISEKNDGFLNCCDDDYESGKIDGSSDMYSYIFQAVKELKSPTN
jgi:hypothetical protein